ncbi:MAG: hypothetical protein QM296_11815 [Bacillota bacterium]|nr:hypothetical protein [Bacillota bacterium]
MSRAIYSTWQSAPPLFFFDHKAAANESIGSSRTGDACCVALKKERKNGYKWVKPRLCLQTKSKGLRFHVH